MNVNTTFVILNARKYQSYIITNNAHYQESIVHCDNQTSINCLGFGFRLDLRSFTGDCFSLTSTFSGTLLSGTTLS